MKKRCLMIGAGGMARGWIRRFLPGFADRLEIVALVDIDPKVLAEQADFLGLSADARFTDYKAAFRTADADFCIVVTPPWVHRGAIEAARLLDGVGEELEDVRLLVRAADLYLAGGEKWTGVERLDRAHALRPDDEEIARRLREAGGNE